MIKRVKPGISTGSMENDGKPVSFSRAKRSSVKSPPMTPKALKGVGSYKRSK